MKAPHYLAAAAVALISAFSGTEGFAAGEIPTGSINVNRSFFRENVTPHVTWEISHPTATVEDIIEIVQPGEITPKEDLYMDVRVVGASIQSGYDRWGNPNWLNVAAYVNADGGSYYTNIFYNTQPNVDPSDVYTTFVHEGRANNFAGRYYSGGWSTAYLTTQNTQNIITLKNGDSPPSYAAAYAQGDVEEFLKPYLEDGVIKIGPLDVIVLFELATTNTNSSYFDMQDLVLLVTFRRL